LNGLRYDDAILLNQDGTVSSTSGGNLFFVRDKSLFTNDELSSIIPGITRDTILTLAAEAGVTVHVRSFTREELLRADEVFMTGTAAEVTPVCEIDGITLATGRDTLAATLQRAYLATVTGRMREHSSWLSYLRS
jgi:branched-chain amino acid aminotransferase